MEIVRVALAFLTEIIGLGEVGIFGTGNLGKNSQVLLFLGTELLGRRFLPQQTLRRLLPNYHFFLTTLISINCIFLIIYLLNLHILRSGRHLAILKQAPCWADLVGVNFELVLVGEDDVIRGPAHDSPGLLLGRTSLPVRQMHLAFNSLVLPTTTFLRNVYDLSVIEIAFGVLGVL